MCMYIYIITNLINDKKYVGLTTQINPEKRWGQHKSESKKSDCSVHRAFRKYGIDNFKFEVIESNFNSSDELCEAEIKWISYYDTFKGHGYNMTSGGEIGKELSEETRKKISDAHRGNNYFLGKTHSEESKKKMSDSMKDKYIGELNPFYGKKHSKETKRLLSLSHSADNLSVETRKKMSDSQRNRKDMSKKVVQYTKDNILVNEFLSIEDACRITKITASNISRCCREIRKTAGGYKWEFKNG